MQLKLRIQVAALAALVVTTTAGAAPFSDQPVTLVVPHAAGTGVDVLARGLAPHLERALGTSIVVENRVGASGSIGSVFVARAKPDGRTLLLNANPPFITYPMTQDKPLYDAQQDFAPIAMVGSTPMMLVVSAASGIENLDQFVAHVNAHPESANYASPGPGSAGHLAMERLQNIKEVDIEHVLYKSTPQSLTDVAAGHILAAIVSVTSAAPMLEGGRLRAIAVGSAARLENYPDVPTLKEATGLDDFEAAVWYGFLGPKGLPEDIVDRLHAGVAQAHAADDSQSVMRNQSIFPELVPPQSFRQRLDTETSQARQLLETVSSR